MNDMHFVKGLVVTLLAYSFVTMMIFVFTDMNIVVRVLGIAAGVFTDLAWKTQDTNKMFNEMMEELDKK